MKSTQSNITNDHRKVLVVDDNVDTLTLAARYLTDPDFEVSLAMDGVEALNLVKSNHFDSVLIDINMPYVDGWRVAALLREEGFEGKIVACSADALENGEFWTMPNSFDDYLKKPFSQAEIFSRLVQ